MSTAQRLTSRINDFLDAGATGAGGDAELERLANEYARLSADVNARLRRCLDFLRRGLRTEAIQYAQTDPELFSLIQSLHLRRVEEWDSLCRARGLERPRPLLLEAAKALNEAYEVERKLDPLLRQHRTLALARAPLRTRIETLRRIADIDPRNGVWVEDLRLLEVSRLTEIVAAIAPPGLVLERAAAEAILDELTDPSRKVKPDPALLRKAQSLASQARLHWAERESNRLLPGLHDAHGALDLDRCKKLMREWDAALMSVGIKLNDLPEEIIERWRPVALWVAGEQDREAQRAQHTQLAGQLREALEQRSGLTELESLHTQVERLRQPSDEALERDYAQAVQSLRLVESRRRRMRTILAAVFSATVLVVIAVLAYDFTADRQTDRLLDDVAAAAMRGDVAAARISQDAMREWKPFMLGRQTWRSRGDAATRTLAAAEERRGRYLAVMREIEATSPAGVSDETLASATSLSLTSDERKAVVEARDQVLRAREETLQRRDAEAIARLTAIATTAQALDPTQLERDAAGFSNNLSRLEAELEALRGAATRRPTVMHALAAVSSHLAGLREMTAGAIAAQQRRAAAEEALRMLPGRAYSADALAQALSLFLKDHADHSYAASFAEALQLADGWRAVEAWTRLSDSWGGHPAPRDRADAARRIVAIDEYLAQQPRSPLAALAAQYRESLASPVLLLKEDGPWQEGVRRMMRTPVMAELNSVQTPDGRRYYCTGDGRFRLSVLGAHLDVSLTSDLSQRTERIFPAGEIEAPRASPQRGLSQSVLQLLRAGDVADAQTLPLQVVQRVAEAEEVDPILRALLLSLLVADATSAEEAMAQELAAWSRPIAGFDLEHVNWMNPEDAAASQLRAEVAAALSFLPSLQPRIDELRAERESLYHRLAARPVASGVMLWENDEPRVMTIVVTPAGAQTVEVVVRRSLMDVLELRQIGTVRAGEVALDQTAARGVPSGSLVLFVQRPEGR